MYSAEDNRRGILSLTLACALFTVNDTLTKLFALVYPPGEVLSARGIGATICIGAGLAYTRELSWLRDIVKPLVLLRATLDATVSTVFVIALSHMRLADLLSITLVSPLLLTMLLAFFLREHVGWRRWASVLTGLIGVMFIVKPSPGAFNIWASVAFCTAALSAVRDLLTRRIDSRVHTLAVTMMSLTAVTIFGLILALVFGERWTVITGKNLSYITVAAIVLTVGTYFAISAFRKVDISVVAPFRYAILVFGALSGYLVLNEVPDNWSLFGAVLIVGSGLYNLHREKKRSRSVSTDVVLH